MNVPKLGLSVVSAFVVVLIFGAVLHALGQDSKQWWFLLLPVWVAGAYFAYTLWPWKWPTVRPAKR